MELNITSAERQSTEAFRNLAYACIALSNDWWSWPKEMAVHIAGKSRLMNAIAIMIKQHNLPAYKARGLVKGLALEYEKKLMDMRSELFSVGTMSEDMRKYIDAVIWMVAGNAVWGSTCPRYNKDLYFRLS
jgi:terpene synthase-like protein